MKEAPTSLCYNRPMRKNVTGILAHVDAGKTTLSEALLYEAGILKKKGRVDTKDSFLDNNAWERERGITIFSKIARLNLGDLELILTDTPGHVDFSGEMERALAVQIGDEAKRFMRIGKRFIVNMNYIHQVDIQKQVLMLSDCEHFLFKIPVSKEALKVAKELVIKTRI